MPPKRVKKPKKPVQQKQKQKQSQRVVVNVNQARPAKRRPVARARQPQQVVYQPLITMSGSVPIPQPYYNPIQSSGGFNPPPPPPSLGTPINSSAPVELPVFAKESVKVIGDERMTAPISAPVPKPVDIIVPIKPVIPDDRVVVMPKPRPPPKPIITLPPVPKPVDIIVPIKPVIPDDRIVVMPKPTPPPKPIITSPPPRLITDGSDRSKFITPAKPPPPVRSEMRPVPSIVNADDNKSIGTLLNEISRDTGINSKSVADFLFKKKKKPEAKKPEEKKPEAKKPEEKKPEAKKTLPFVPEPLVFERESGRVEELGRYDPPDFRPMPNSTRAGFNIPDDKSLSSVQSDISGLSADVRKERKKRLFDEAQKRERERNLMKGEDEMFQSDSSYQKDSRAVEVGLQQRGIPINQVENELKKMQRQREKKIVAEMERQEDNMSESYQPPYQSSYQPSVDSKSILTSNGSRVEELSDTSGYETATRAVRDAERKNREIARRYESEGGFNIPSDKSLTRNSIIVGDAPPIVLPSGSSGKTKKNPYDVFAQSETVSDMEDSDSSKSKRGYNIIPEERVVGGGRPLNPISEKNINKMNQAELQAYAKSLGIKTMQSGKTKAGKDKPIKMSDLRDSITQKLGK